MTGGKIAENSAAYGAGVYVAGTFEMRGGVIDGNASAYGGGVYVSNNAELFW